MTGRLRVGAYAVAERAGSILLARIAPGYPNAGTWTLPGGGVAFGEHPDAGLRREVWEETGLSVAAVEPLGADSLHVPAKPAQGADAVHWIRIFYRVGTAGTPQVLESAGSVDHAAWVPLGEITAASELVRAGLAQAGIDV